MRTKKAGLRDTDAECVVAEWIEMRSGMAHAMLFPPEEIESDRFVSRVIHDSWVSVQGNDGRRIARVAGLSLNVPVSPQKLDEVLDFCWSEGAAIVRVRAVSNCLGLSLHAQLVERGFVVAAKLQQWAFDITGSPSGVPGHDIREIGPNEADAFARIIAANYHLPKNANLQKYRNMVGAPGERCFVAYVDGIPAGTGRMYVEGGFTAFGYGTTEKAYRNRGIQRDMIFARLLQAQAMGVRYATATTFGNDRSSRNLVRCGFYNAGTVSIYEISRITERG